MRSLSILFTNNTLSARAGSELWVRDVARALVVRRHRPMAFSLVTGAVAAELHAATIPVVTDLANVAAAPDLIHGHHHLETLIAALHFPGVPVVHFCHGWLPWEERPLRHPSIVRYVAVDDTCAERLTCEEGIAPERVDRLLNFVDLERFQPRAPLPARPRRALVFSNYARDDGYAAIIREACGEAGIELAVAGLASGRVIDRPEMDLREFDLVFAKGRSALEALAVGCAVIVTDAAGAGPLVTSPDFDYLRSRNFGARVLQQPHAVAWYRRHIAAYDAADARAVSGLVREHAGLDGAVDQLLQIYARAIDEHASLPQVDAAASRTAQRAAARHLCSMALKLKEAHGHVVRGEALARDLDATAELSRHLMNERDALQRLLADAQAERSHLTNDRAALQQLLADAQAERSHLLNDHATLQRLLADAQAGRSHLMSDRDALQRLLADAQAERSQLTSDRAARQAEHETVRRALSSAEDQRRAAMERERQLQTAMADVRHALAYDEELIAAYRALAILRLRDAVLRVPIVGGAARRAARWMAGAVPTRRG